MGWKTLMNGLIFWNNKKDILSIDKFWDENVNEDWIWGLALPLLSQAYKFNKNFSEEKNNWYFSTPWNW